MDEQKQILEQAKLLCREEAQDVLDNLTGIASDNDYEPIWVIRRFCDEFNKLVNQMVK